MKEISTTLKHECWWMTEIKVGNKSKKIQCSFCTFEKCSGNYVPKSGLKYLNIKMRVKH